MTAQVAVLSAYFSLSLDGAFIRAESRAAHNKNDLKARAFESEIQMRDQYRWKSAKK